MIFIKALALFSYALLERSIGNPWREQHVADAYPVTEIFVRETVRQVDPADNKPRRYDKHRPQVHVNWPFNKVCPDFRPEYFKSHKPFPLPATARFGLAFRKAKHVPELPFK